jgi:hypothetical protein
MIRRLESKPDYYGYWTDRKDKPENKNLFFMSIKNKAQNGFFTADMIDKFGRSFVIGMIDGDRLILNKEYTLDASPDVPSCTLHHEGKLIPCPGYGVYNGKYHCKNPNSKNIGGKFNMQKFTDSYDLSFLLDRFYKENHF